MIMEARPKVYFIEEPLRNKPGVGMIRRVNLAPAEKFGEIQFLLDWTEIKDAGGDYRPLVWKIRERMDYGPEDFIGCVGSMSATALAVAIAAEQNGGRVRLLEWNNDLGDYVIKILDVHAQPLETESR